jgi:lipoprotein-anchoring transpeptidase ErfK/SrfK
MVHQHGVVRSTRLVALLAGLGLAAVACSSGGPAASQTVVVNSTVAASGNTASVTVAGSAGGSTTAPTSSDPAASGAPTSGAQASGTQASGVPASSPPASGPATSGPATSGPATSGPATSGAAASSSPAAGVNALPVAKVSASPAFGSKTVGVADPLKISVQQGRITDVKVTTCTGHELKGAVSADGTSWSLGEVLGYGKTYTASGTATGTDGKAVPIAGSFSTVVPTSKVRTTISPSDGDVVGVATPVIVAFAVNPADRAAIAKAVSIRTTPKVTGAWVWIQHDDKRWALDFRPAVYWPANTKVHVEVKVYGLKFAAGAYGSSDVTSDFTIGRNQVVKADVNSHFLQVFRDGHQVASYPASYGKGDTPDKITRSGVHVVNDLFPTKLMSNPKYGYVNVLEHWAVRISDNGEFIHANPKTVGDQGNTNVSHGCVNLSLKDAEAYFKSAMRGDPVEVTGTTIKLQPSDGDIFDWTYPWQQWKNLAVKTY